jgi:signal transduction histidine kinase
MINPPHTYDLLKSIVQLSVTSLPLHVKLDRMIQSISAAFQSDRCLLLRPEKIAENGFLSRLAKEKKPLWVEEGSSFQKEDVLSEEEGLLCPTFACIPLYDETSFRGILYMGFSKPQTFSPQEVELLPLMGEAMVGAIRNDHLHQKSEETISELTALYEMGKAVASTLKLENLFQLIVTTGLKILNAKGGVLRVEDKKTKELKVKWSVGDYHQNPLDEKIAKRVFYTQTPLFFNHSGEEKPFFSILCAPFLSQGKILGTLAFYDKDSDSSKFDKKDFHLFLMMVNQLSLAMENALTHYEISNMAQENEKRVAQLSSLWELNKALLTTVNFERILHLTLTAITIGEGLKFNRAMLFLVNEKDHLLQGVIAVGPDSAEEAGRIWDTLSQRKGPLLDRIAQLTPPGHSHLNEIVKGIRIPLEQEQCILSRTVLEGKPFIIQFSQSKEGWLHNRCERGCHLGSEVGCYVGEHLSRDPKVYSFATVPLMGKGKVIGVILVDNLYNQNPITEEDIHFLSMFSNHAGLAIENAILYRNLEEVHQELKETQNLLIHREKMVALGELSNSIAHEIKNPLVSIGGFARRLYRAIPDDAMEKRYTQTIMIEVARLEKILTDIFNYTHEESISFKECDLQKILEDNLSMIQASIDTGGIELVKEFSEGIPQIHGDYHQLREVFSNLIHNAYQAMKGRGTLSLRLHPITKNGASYVRVEVGDTGGGIDPENLHNIFNPFYTTKDSSLGLGLPIVHKIITTHRGQIEVDNQPGKGVNFIITLPTSERGKESRFKAAEDNQ